MKLDKLQPLHWLYLLMFSINTLLAMLARLLWRGRDRRNIAILYGHKLNGNLKAILDYSNDANPRVQLYFLTMDPMYYRQLRRQGQPVLLALNPFDMLKLVFAYAIISDHGLHILILLLKYTDLRFIDVWHGIPFKGFDGDDFRVQHQYDEIWLPSETLRRLYSGRFGFAAHKLVVTGYARTDPLVRGGADLSAIKDRLGIVQKDLKIILFAPTWQQDDKRRNIFPFGIEEDAFLRQLDRFCQRHGACCILRKHLNTQARSGKSYGRIIHQSYADFPDAEAVLQISDILICDWSSIAFDYLLLNRPTIFLDVPAPFKKGLSLDACYRFGEIVADIKPLFAALDRYLQQPHDYLREHGASQQNIRRALYDDMADGHAAERCYNRLLGMKNGPVKLENFR
jgi:CDP-glycerol glycerophosphotransferase (TagB/SpsB family)